MRDQNWYNSQHFQQLYYLQIKRWLRNLIHEWNQGEHSGLEFRSKLDHLESISDKLERSVFQIAVFGMVGRGKSSILNALIQRQVFKTGAQHGITQSIESLELEPKVTVNSEQVRAVASYRSVASSQILTASDSRSDCLKQNRYPTAELVLSQNWSGTIQLFDTPGLDEVNGCRQNAVAYRLANQVDLVLFVITGDLNQVEYEAIAKLRQQNKPLLLVFNKVDQYSSSDRLAIYQQICNHRIKEFISPSEIVLVAAAPTQLRGIVDQNGKISRQRSLLPPQIEQLEQKIAEVISQRGQSLITLNNGVAANIVNQQLVQLKIKQLDLAVNNLVVKLIWLKALLIGLNPLGVIDLFLGTSIDLGLILALSALYGISLPSIGTLPILSVITLGVAAIGSVDLLLHLVLKYLFATTDTLGSTQAYLPLIVSWSSKFCQGIIAGASVVVLGQIAKQQFCRSLSWGNYQLHQIIQATTNSLGSSPSGRHN